MEFVERKVQRMSVEKVNKYKEDKKNRKAFLEKERKKKKLYRICGWAAGIVIVAALVVMLGLTARNSYNNYVASLPNYDADSLVISDMTGILSESEMSEEDADKDAEKTDKDADESAEDADTSGESVEDTTASGETEAQ